MIAKGYWACIVIMFLIMAWIEGSFKQRELEREKRYKMEAIKPTIQADTIPKNKTK
jgi:hypothetical protein